MAIRLRYLNQTWVALCAARSIAKPGDVYLDDGHHYALAGKFAQDWNSTTLERNGRPLPEHPDENALREVEESNNANRDAWELTYGVEACVSPMAKTHAFLEAEDARMRADGSLPLPKQQSGPDLALRLQGVTWALEAGLTHTTRWVREDGAHVAFGWGSPFWKWTAYTPEGFALRSSERRIRRWGSAQTAMKAYDKACPLKPMCWECKGRDTEERAHGSWWCTRCQAWVTRDPTRIGE